MGCPKKYKDRAEMYINSSPVMNMKSYLNLEGRQLTLDKSLNWKKMNPWKVSSGKAFQDLLLFNPILIQWGYSLSSMFYFFLVPLREKPYNNNVETF